MRKFFDLGKNLFSVPAGIYRQWSRFDVFIVNFEHISHLCSSVSIVNFEHVIAGWGIFISQERVLRKKDTCITRKNISVYGLRL